MQSNIVFRVPANISTTIMSEILSRKYLYNIMLMGFIVSGTRYLISSGEHGLCSTALYGYLLLLYVLVLLIVMIKALKTYHLKYFM